MNPRHIVVPGRPVAQGSMRSFGPRSVVPSNQQQLMHFRMSVLEVWHREGGDVYGGPIDLQCDFVFERPNTHYLPVNRKRATRMLRPDAPESYTRTPDVDKMIRAVADALTGHAYTDDAQCVRMSGMKRWASDVEQAHTFIRIYEV